MGGFEAVILLLAGVFMVVAAIRVRRKVAVLATSPLQLPSLDLSPIDELSARLEGFQESLEELGHVLSAFGGENSRAIPATKIALGPERPPLHNYKRESELLRTESELLRNALHSLLREELPGVGRQWGKDFRSPIVRHAIHDELVDRIKVRRSISGELDNITKIAHPIYPAKIVRKGRTYRKKGSPIEYLVTAQPGLNVNAKPVAWTAFEDVVAAQLKNMKA